MNVEVPPIAYLGVVDRVLKVPHGDTGFFHFDLSGLRGEVFAPLYPLPLKGLKLLLAVYDASTLPPITLKLTTAKQGEVLQIESRFEIVEREDGREMSTLPAWNHFIFEAPDGVLLRPESLYVSCVLNGCDFPLGMIPFGVSVAPELTDERIRAIKADPFSLKSVRIEYSCKECLDDIRAYTSTEAEPDLVASGWVWFRDLPDEFVCSCGKTSIPLEIIKQNLHGMLGGDNRPSLTGEIQVWNRYSVSGINELVKRFGAVLQEATREEELQTFIEDNLLLLNLFSPQRVFFKAPILSKFKTDFAILSHSKELILIEIEKASTRILKADAGLHSEAQHAMDQVQSWLSCTSEHRAAVLDGIGLLPSEVGAIRGAVVLGRDRDWPSEDLRRLKARDFGQIRFLTYDDILAHLLGLGNQMDSMGPGSMIGP